MGRLTAHALETEQDIHAIALAAPGPLLTLPPYAARAEAAPAG